MRGKCMRASKPHCCTHICAVSSPCALGLRTQPCQRHRICFNQSTATTTVSITTSTACAQPSASAPLQHGRVLSRGRSLQHTRACLSGHRSNVQVGKGGAQHQAPYERPTKALQPTRSAWSARHPRSRLTKARPAHRGNRGTRHPAAALGCT